MVANTHNTSVHNLRCNACIGVDQVFVDNDRWHKYTVGRALVQDAFPEPEFDSAYREQMIGIRTGYHVCNDCWDTVLKEEE